MFLVVLANVWKDGSTSAFVNFILSCSLPVSYSVESLIVGGGAKLANKAYKMIDAFAETL